MAKRYLNSFRDIWLFSSEKQRIIILFIITSFIAVEIFFISFGRYYTAICCWVCLILCELFMKLFVTFLDKKTTFIIKDEVPVITSEVLNKFYDHGFDPELGWVRKANTAKIDLGVHYEIDYRGSRRNPGHEDLPLYYSTYGDSYTFCREVADSETWQWYLSENTEKNVLNFGVGNYGFDQALIRLKREYPNYPTSVVIFGVVPQSIARNLSVWKHYNEHGNTLAFKPRYKVTEEGLTLIPNIINIRERFFRLKSFLPSIQQNDYFYDWKYKRDAFRFPFSLSCILHPKMLLAASIKIISNKFLGMQKVEKLTRVILQNLLKNEGIAQTVSLYNNREAISLFTNLVGEFVEYSKQKDFLPVFVMLPMKDDLFYIKNNGSFYNNFMRNLENTFKPLVVIDAAETLLSSGPVENLFAKWHYNPSGNKSVAAIIKEELKQFEFSRHSNVRN